MVLGSTRPWGYTCRYSFKLRYLKGSGERFGFKEDPRDAITFRLSYIREYFGKVADIVDKCILEMKKVRSFENSSPDPCFSKVMVKRRNIDFRVEVWKMGNRFRITGVEVILY